MSTNSDKIKNHWHKLVSETNDENILSKVQDYFTTLKQQNVDWWDTISDRNKETIHIGLQQLENGEGIPHQQVKDKVNKLFGRK